jgi:nicotinamidase/pyrazinamidase
MITIQKHLTAGFDVDPQRCFTPLCPDELPVAEGHRIGDELNRQAQLVSYRIVSKDCHPPDAPWMARGPEEIMTPVEGGYPGLDVRWPPHCIIDSEGACLIPGLPKEEDYDLVIEKGMDPFNHPYGACYHDLAEQKSTGVIEWLRQRDIFTIVVGGLATDYCVKNTVLQLRRAGFRVIVNLAACRGVADDSSAAAIDAMRATGAEMIKNCSELESV